MIMGCINTISFDKFPKQGEHVGKRVEVCFHYDISKTVFGTVVRDDYEEPWETIIKLDNGRYIKATECQYAILP